MKRLTTFAVAILLSCAGIVLAQNVGGGAFVTNFPYVVSGQWTWRTILVPFVFEGTTDDTYEQTLGIASNPSTDGATTLPVGTYTVVGDSLTQTLTAKTLTSPTITTPTITTPTITNPIITTAMVAGGSSLTLTAAAHGGKTIALDTAAGTTITLPAASGSGVSFCFLVTVAATSNQHRVNVVGNDAFFGGIAQGNDSDNTIVVFPAGADADQINMSGTATGGTKGATYCITDMVTDGWHIFGNSDASGTEATPFATGQVS